MHLMKNGFPQQSISPEIRNRKARKEISGSVQVVTAIYFMVFLGILLYTQFQLFLFRASGMYLEDALTASNLAAAVPDIGEYGASHRVRIADVREAYSRYKTAVKENLELNDSWEASNIALISGAVIIEQFIVYNVEEDRVVISYVPEQGKVREEWGVLGNVRTPDGNPVTHTGIYSEISFPVKGFAGITVRARKGKFVDIVSEEGGEL